MASVPAAIIVVSNFHSLCSYTTRLFALDFYQVIVEEYAAQVNCYV